MPAHRVNKRVYTRPVNAHTQARDCAPFRVPHLTAKTAASAGFWLGQCPVAARGEENFESSVVSLHPTPPHPDPHSENCSFYIIIIIIYLLKSTEQEDAHMINTRTRAGARFSKLLKIFLSSS